MKLAIAVCFVILVAAYAEGDWSENCYFGSSLCNADTGCSYGCWKNVCWSQCNGICSIADIIEQMKKKDEIHDGHDIIDKLTPDSSTCAKCAEWCYLDDGEGNYNPCNSNSDCDAVKLHQCVTHCAVI
ncbi:uncharacterized protein LOC134822465 [Bolinopsis microptera]|uniref:uncharacterized protein LOC134822465 n=1 Tax=Bolinopsis microptera TaxID=2820187 RepID=UPI00307A3D12